MTALREQYRFGAPVGRARASCAFTLVEVLIAIAILGVGITMAAALFPTAIKQNQRSANDTIGMIVAKNALAVVKAKVTATAATLADNFQDIGTAPLDLLTEADLTYPVPRQPADAFNGDPPGEPNDWWDDSGQDRPLALRGAIVLGRQMTPGANDYQLVIVSFAKQRSANTIEAVPVSSSDTTIVQQPDWEWAELRVTGSAAASLQRGGVVVFDYLSTNPDFAGTFARIRAVQPGSGRATLDRKFEDDDNDGDVDVNGLNIWLIIERDANPPNGVVGAWSPVTSVLVTRTALRN